MATKSSQYKRYNRDNRHSVVETAFGAGMNYTDNPLLTGRSRLLVNLIQKDSGVRARPRGGLHPIVDALPLNTQVENPYIHHSGQTLVYDEVTKRTELMRYSLVISVPADYDNKEFVPFANSMLVIEEPYDRDSIMINDTLDEQTYVGGALKLSFNTGATELIRHDPLKDLIKTNDMLVHDPTPIGMWSSIEGNTYVMTSTGMARLAVTVNSGTYGHSLEPVQPKVLSPMNAVTTGYNMLLDAPYVFENAVGAAARVTGVLPYDPTAQTRIKVTARVGDPILFRATYIYEAGVAYKFKWEIVDLDDQQRTVHLLQSAEGSPEYTDGADATFTYAPPYKRFTIIVTMYKSADLAVPVFVMPLPFITLTSNDNIATRSMANYDFKTVSHMTSWKGQLVVTGVKEAEMGLFISAPFDPTYFPYPKNFISLPEPIIKTVVYMDSLMALTDTSIYLITMTAEGYTSKRVQANLEISRKDVSTIFSVRNMVHFKSGNHYYLVVPDLRNDLGNLQIAPITIGMTHWFDNFKAECVEMLDTLYGLTETFGVAIHEQVFRLEDYKCVLDSNRIRNVHHISIEVAGVKTYLDVQLVYDTIFRSWTIEVYETGKVGMFPFRSLATGYTQYLSIYKEGVTYSLQWLEVREDHVADTYTLDEKRAYKFTNQQLLDTGKRDMQSELKKRFRHVIVEFNNLADKEIPVRHMFMIDDMERADLYNYTVEHVVDPNSPDYGLLYVERSYTSPDAVPSEQFVSKTYTPASLLAGATKLNTWMLSTSQFPDVSVIKAHIDVSGKGYYPRLKLLMKEPNLYEINNINWVWRDMNAR